MTKYDDVIRKAPNPELADKIMHAFYILSRGQANVPVSQADAMALVHTMTIEEMRAEAQKIRRAKLN